MVKDVIDLLDDYLELKAQCDFEEERGHNSCFYSCEYGFGDSSLHRKMKNARLALKEALESGKSFPKKSKYATRVV
jgi:hypothetical protein